MPRTAQAPAPLVYKPFRGSSAVALGLLTRRQLAGPAWRRLFRDVYVSSSVPVDQVTMCLSVPPSSRIGRSGGLVVHRVGLSPGDVVRRGGVPVTSVNRTAFDLGSGPDLVEAVVALDTLLFQRVIKVGDLASLVALHAGRPGSARFRSAVGLARADVESPMETRTRLTLVLGGLLEPCVQCLVRDRSGVVVARLDLAYEALRIGIEYDGDHHRERDTFRRDAVRLNRLRLLGWTVLRFTADDVLRHPSRLLAQVVAAIRIATTNGGL